MGDGFVNIASKVDDDEFMELPHENDGSLLLSTIQAQFPTAIGLKYKSSSGGWRGIRAEENILSPPSDGWGNVVYVVTESAALKRKPEESRSSDRDSERDSERKRRKRRKFLDDLIVLGLPFTTTQEELSQFFTEKCGELDFCEIKLDRETQKSRGFGFIRFKTVEAAEEAVLGCHEMDGRKLEVRLSRRGDEVPMKLFVGRLGRDTTKDEVNDYFSEYGDLVDVFVPAGRGFAFITYADKEDAMRVLETRRGHRIKGSELNVTAAQPKEDRGAMRQENYGVVSTTPRDDGYQVGGASRYGPSSSTNNAAGNDAIKDNLRDMLRSILSSETDQRR